MSRKVVKYLDRFVTQVCDTIGSNEFKERSKTNKVAFIRNRKMNFQDTFIFILSNEKKTLQAAINSFVTKSKMKTDSYSKQAFSKRRLLIKPEAFKEIFNMSVDFIYDETPPKTFNGYHLLAIDGSKLNLPTSDELKEIYGIQKSTNELVQSLCSCLYDVQTGAIVDAVMHPCNANEREIAVEHIEKLSKFKQDKTILLFDRGYPSSKLIQEIEDRQFKYIMRTDNTFIMGMKLSSDDCIIEHKFKSSKTFIKLRVIKITDEKGIQQNLITNIFNEFDKAQFWNIYHMRWCIEEKYNDLKNKFQLENFSGTSNIAVLQDFYSTMFLNNMAVLAMLENEEKLKIKNNESVLKYEYKSNMNMIIAELKTNIVDLLLSNSKLKQLLMLKAIIKRLSKCIIPIRPKRSFDRNVKHKSSKFHMNTRSF